MKHLLRPLLVAAFLSGLPLPAGRAADVLSVTYPPSTQPGELAMEATFHVWIPPAAKRVHAVIVHQHGCGDGAENSGETAALDLHWRALAARHDAALLSPHYRAKGANCRLWCDPRNGSGAVFQRALADLGRQSGHPELATAPWCLWGHSGGGFWASLMLEKHADRIVAMHCRSGSALPAWEKGEVPRPEYPAAAFGVPIVLNPGAKENGDARFSGAWTGSVKFFELLRGKGAPAAFVPDPLSSHDCRNSRLFAIPFFDACLRLRLPASGDQLKPVPAAAGLAGDWQTGRTQPAKGAPPTLSWLPDEKCARAFTEYVKTGVTTDTTPPEQAPVLTRVTADAGAVTLEWTAAADFESGIRQFAIYRDGQLLTRFPEKPKDPTGFAQFQTLSYHDTPTPDAPALRFMDKTVPAGARPTYAVAVINGAGLEGPRSAAGQPPSGK